LPWSGGSLGRTRIRKQVAFHYGHILQIIGQIVVAKPFFDGREIALHPLQPEIYLGMIVNDQREFLVEPFIYVFPVERDRLAAQIDAVWRRDVGNNRGRCGNNGR
jgi:hypothetical protein